MNKIEIKITTKFCISGMNTARLVTNNTNKTYNDNCGVTGGRSEWEYIPHLSQPYLFVLKYPSIQKSWIKRK